eukprot:UN07398
MSCNTYNTPPSPQSLDDYHLDNDSRCYVQQDGKLQMYANAICCQLTQSSNYTNYSVQTTTVYNYEPTYGPTSGPTSEPVSFVDCEVNPETEICSRYPNDDIAKICTDVYGLDSDSSAINSISPFVWLCIFIFLVIFLLLLSEFIRFYIKKELIIFMAIG